MSNQSTNKTAMSQLLDWIEAHKQENFAYPFASDIEAKAIELRDTVEKEQWIEAYKKGAFDYGGEDVDFGNGKALQKDAEQRYNETYGS